MIKRALRRDPGGRRRRGRGRTTTCPIIRARATPSPPIRKPPRRRSACRRRWRRAIRRRSAPIVSRRSSARVRGLLSARLAEMAQKPDAPFLDAQTNRGAVRADGRGRRRSSALVADGGVEKGLAALFTEADRVARFGFTQTELDRYRLAIMRIFEQLAVVATTSTRRTRSPTSSSATSCSRSRFPASPTSTRSCSRFLPEITLADVNSLARDWVPDRNRVVAVSAPKKAGVAVPDEAALAAVIKSAGGGCADRVRRHGERQAAARAAAQAAARSRRPATKPAGITEWTLSNGVRVVLRSDDVQAGRDPVPRLQSGRHVARERQRLRAAETADQVVLAGRPRHAERDRSWQEARGQGGVRAPRHRRDVRRAQRPRAEPRSRDDVPADLPDVHAAARRRRGVSRRRPAS